MHDAPRLGPSSPRPRELFSRPISLGMLSEIAIAGAGPSRYLIASLVKNTGALAADSITQMEPDYEY